MSQLKIWKFRFGKQMVAHICRKPEGRLSYSSTQVNSWSASDLGIFASERYGNVGSRQRITELYDLLRPSLHAYLCNLSMNVDQAEDVIQDTFLRLVNCRFGGGIAVH